MLHDIWQAETREDAHAAFDLFIDSFEAKYPKAAECLIKDRDELLTFYDFPAQHWQSIRTSNPIESAFATIRHRTKRTKGCLSRDGMLHAVVDITTRKVLKDILVGRCAWGLGLSPDASTLIVLNGLSDDFTIIDLSTRRPIFTRRAGLTPNSIEVLE